MKPKTIAESIADLRSTLDAIESSSTAKQLHESTKSLTKLEEHMQNIEAEYLTERKAKPYGSLGSMAYNMSRGLRGKKNVKPGYNVADPTTKGGDPIATWAAAPSSLEKAGHSIGKGLRTGAIGLGGGALVGAGALGANKYNTGEFFPGDDKKTDTNTKPDTKSNTKPDTTNTQGTETPPAQHSQYSDSVAALQTMLVKLGMNLGTTGPNHDGVDGVYGSLTKQAEEKFNQMKGGGKTPPAQQTALPAQQTAPPAQQTAPPAQQTALSTQSDDDAEYNKQMSDLMNMLKALQADVQSKLPDPKDRADFDNMMRNVNPQ